MASLGHLAVGLAASRLDAAARPLGLARIAIWSALSLLPDLDVVGFSLGVQYGDPWGHRGATHSLTMAVVIGVVAAAVAPALKQPALRTGTIATFVVASHGLLDTMTDGGLGCALLWPFDLTRYFAPWRPIPVAPIGLAFLTPGGLLIAIVELALFFPLIAFALPSGRVRRAAHGPVGLAAWAVGAWLLVSTDPVREAAIGIVLREDTAYTSGFSERGFRAIAPGDSEDDVQRLIGAPRGQSWFYGPPNQPASRAEDLAASALLEHCFSLLIENGTLTGASAAAPCRQRGVEPGMSAADVASRLGAPTESCWSYSWSPGGLRHRVRMVCFVGTRVDVVVRQWAR